MSDKGTESIREMQIDEDIAARVEDRVPYTEFDSASEYVEHVLEEVLYHVEDASDGEAREAFDEGEVEDRLESLGYLNE